MAIDDAALESLARAAERELHSLLDIDTFRELVAAYHLQAAALVRFEARTGADQAAKDAVLERLS